MSYIPLFPDALDGWNYQLRIRLDKTKPLHHVYEGSGQPQPPYDTKGHKINAEDDIHPVAPISPQLNDSDVKPDTATTIDGPAEPENFSADDSVDDEPTEGAE